MQALFASTAMVAIAEMGDKTQLLSFILAARFKRQPWPIILGILVATLANHALAGLVGGWLSAHVGPQALRWSLAAVFIAFAVWALIPDKLEEKPDTRTRYGAFLTTLVVFFVAEIGDKTQLATVALAAQYNALVAVVVGTTLGMMIANVPAVLLGETLTRYIPLRVMRLLAAALFALFGVLILIVG